MLTICPKCYHEFKVPRRLEDCVVRCPECEAKFYAEDESEGSKRKRKPLFKSTTLSAMSITFGIVACLLLLLPPLWPPVVVLSICGFVIGLCTKMSPISATGIFMSGVAGTISIVRMVTFFTA